MKKSVTEEEWQEYLSREYRFKIKYPSELHPFEYDGKKTIGFEAQGWKSGNVIIFCEPFQNHKTLDDLTKEYSSNIPKDRLMSLKTIRISNNSTDAIELIQDTQQQYTEFSKIIYITLIKDNVRYLLAWYGHDRVEDIEFFYRMVDSFEFV